MFIEQFNNKEIEKFANIFNFRVSKYKMVSKGKYQVEFLANGMDTQPEFYLSDFCCQAANNSSKIFENLLDKHWRKYMFDHFGEKYKEAFNQELQKIIMEMQI